MPENQRRQEDIDRLIGLLGPLTQSWSQEDKGLLADIFEVAQEALHRSARERFLGSFEPGIDPQLGDLGPNIRNYPPDGGSQAHIT